MKPSLFDAIQEKTLLADGGMSSAIYEKGFFINACYDQLNLASPDVIQDIHESFAEAGAEILTANTFGANRIILNEFGIAEKTEAINKAGVELARDGGLDAAYIAGSIGPIPDDQFEAISKGEYRAAYQEQAQCLADAGADFIYLESFATLAQLREAAQIVLGLNLAIPVIPSILHSALENGSSEALEGYVAFLRSAGVAIAGVNGAGPQESLDLLTALNGTAQKKIRFYMRPSAGLPQMVSGRMLYLASPEYMAEFGRRYVQKSAAIVGGDAGITPEMIKEIYSYIRSIQPGKKRIEVVDEPSETDESMEPIPLKERSRLGGLLNNAFPVSVELSPPKGIDAAKSAQGAKFLYDHGIDAVNIADGPRASGRMSPIALAQLVREVTEIETIVHVCCRDRNILALQMDLISANALGLRNLMLITGDPPKMGIYPDATAVFDFDAIGLIQGANLLNHGLDFAKRPLFGQTSFVIGIGCNPGAVDLDLEAHRYEQKVNAGADYAFSQPVYDPELFSAFLKKVSHVRAIPFFVGILPLASFKNAEFLHNNVPGMQIPDDIRGRIRKAPTKESQRDEGIKIAAEALKEASQHEAVKGTYIFPPFGRYQSVLDVLERSGVR